MKIGEDTKLERLEVRWHRNNLVITRGGRFVVEVERVGAVKEEARDVSESCQRLLLLKVDCGHGARRSFFIDHDPVQSNVREVDPNLEDLDAVLAWLLPPGYAHRQGDIGVYAVAELPEGVEPVAAAEHAERFADVLGGRHTFEETAQCRFFAGEGDYIVHVERPVRLVHPEHEPLSIGVGTYKIVGANGAPLPAPLEVREGKPFMLVF